MIASEYGHLPVVEVSYPVQVHSRRYIPGIDWLDCLKIYMFIERYSKWIVLLFQALLNSEANIEAEIESGGTSLMIAYMKGHLDVVVVSCLFQVHSRWLFPRTDWSCCPGI